MRPVEAIALVLSILFILSLQLQHQQFVFYRILCEYWLRELSSVLFITLNRRARRRRLRRLRRIPYAWTVPRPLNSWFELHCHDRTIPEEYFRQQLRMKKDTFDVVLNLLGYRLVRQDTRFRDAIPSEKVLALGLYRLGHGNSYNSIGPVFNVGKSTTIEAVQDVVNGLYELRNEWIKFPQTPVETAAVIETFEEYSELPNVAGAIDGSHVRIIAPIDSAVDYFSRYQQHDFIIQAVVDGRKMFMDFSCGYPGAMHDGRVFRRSNIYRLAEARQILTEPTVHIRGHEIGPYLVGDSAYPCSQYLMKPYPEGTRDPDEKKFNKQLSKARVKVECAFGILKSRWRVLLKRFDSGLEFAVKCAIACAVLHNICIRYGDEWEDDANEQDPLPPNPAVNAMQDGDDIREVLKDYLRDM